MKPERFWGSWNAARPAEFFNIKSGLSITPLLYAASTGKTSWLLPSQIELGTHKLDSSLVNWRANHAGTHLTWTWKKHSPTQFFGEWRTQSHGEWGLRFWVSLVLTGGLWQWQQNTAWCKTKHGYVALRPAKNPLLITAHKSTEALASEFEEKGYWYLASRAQKGKCLALRFNLDEMPNMRFGVGEGNSKAEAIQAASVALEDSASPPMENNALAAMRDILGWNSLWDDVNKRAYTACTRNWDIGKFGGFGIWLTDTAINALLLSAFDRDMASENLAALRAHQTKQGNFPCLVTGHDAWPDRSQPPLLSLIIWLIYLRDGDETWLAENYKQLARNHAWWWQMRDGNGNGILEYGSSAVGDGLYVGTKLAAKDESFMDNSPMHDEAIWQETTRTLDMEDVGLNSLIALDAEILSHIAKVLKKPKDARDYTASAEKMRSKIKTHFWDAKRKRFANRLWSGKFADAITPTSFYPLIANAAEPHQIKAMLRLLKSPKEFGGKFGLPSVARNHPSYKDDVYWRGRIWPILNWLVWLGLKRQAAFKEAEALRIKSIVLFQQSWKSRKAPENFNADTGFATGPDTDGFYSWTALLPEMDVAGLVDVDPFTGFTLINNGPNKSLGPIRSPWGMVFVRRERGCISIHDLQGTQLFASRRKGRITANYRG